MQEVKSWCRTLVVFYMLLEKSDCFMYFEPWLFFCVLYLPWISCFAIRVEIRWCYTIYMWLFRKSETTYLNTAVQQKLMSLMRFNSFRALAFLTWSWQLRQFLCIPPSFLSLLPPLCGLPFSVWVFPEAPCLSTQACWCFCLAFSFWMHHSWGVILE